MNEAVKKRLIDRTVDVVLALRTEYLRTATPNVIRHWTLIQERLRAATRTRSNPQEWATYLARALRLEAPSVFYAQALKTLVEEVEGHSTSAEWLRLLDLEWEWVMALAREAAEKRKEEHV